MSATQETVLPYDGNYQRVTDTLKKVIASDVRAEGWQIDEGIWGALRGLRRQTEFREAAALRGLDLDNPPAYWEVSFQMGTTGYLAIHRKELIRDAASEPLILVRIGSDSSRMTRMESLRDNIGIGHSYGSALSIGSPNGALTGMEALADLTRAYPELGLAWH